MRVFKPTAVRAYPARVVSVWKFNVTSKGVPVRRLRPQPTGAQGRRRCWTRDWACA
jgi:hypothetical protein